MRNYPTYTEVIKSAEEQPKLLGRSPAMLRFVHQQAGWFQELLFILAGMICLLALTALVIAPRRHDLPTGESDTLSPESSFDPRKNGRGTFFPWVPVA
jgi:hypothetical protein